MVHTISPFVPFPIFQAYNKLLPLQKIEATMLCVKQSAKILLFLFIFTLSCESTTMEDVAVTVEASDLQVTIPENPEHGYEIGTVPTSSSGGDLVYKMLTQVPSGAFAVNDTSGMVTVANAALFDFETNPTLNAAIIVDNTGVLDTATVTVALLNVIEVAGVDLAVTIPENPSQDQFIGEVMQNPDGQIFSILSQSPANAFSIDSEKGSVRVAMPVLFDYEMHQTLSASVLISGGGELDTANVLVTLTDVLEIVVEGSDFDTLVTENPLNGQSLGFLMANANSDSLDFYLLSQNPEGAMLLDPSTGELTVSDSSYFDYEVRTSVSAEAVIAHKESQITDTVSIIINIANIANEPFINASNVINHEFNEVVIGSVYLLSFNSNISGALNFEIKSQSVDDAFQLVFNPNQPHTIQIHTDDKSKYEKDVAIVIEVRAYKGTVEKVVTLNLTPIDPIDKIIITLTDFEGNINENPTANAVVGNVNAAINPGPYTGGYTQYILLDQSPEVSGGYAFQISNTGNIFVSPHAAPHIDYETENNYKGRYVVNRYLASVPTGSFQTDTANFNVNILDVFEATISATGFSTTIPENPENGATLGTINASTDSGTIAFSVLNSNPPGAFAVDPTTGIVTVADSALFDYELHTELHANISVTVDNVVENAHVTVFLTNEIDAVQDRLNNGETPFQIYNSDNSLLGEIHGSYYQGGYIAHLNLQNGSGLVVYPTELSPAGWGCDSTLTEATATHIFTGKTNTNIILNSSCSDTTGAAFLANDLEWQGYTDWHLPSRDELLAVFLHVYLKDVGNMLNAIYWTSTEADQFRGTALSFSKTGHSELSVLKTSDLMRYRPVRYFTEPLGGSKR